MINLDMDMHKSNILIFSAAVLIAPSLLVSCSTKYGSKLEASRASASWAEGGKKVLLWYDVDAGRKERTSTKFCIDEEETSQFVCVEVQTDKKEMSYKKWPTLERKYTYFRY